MALTNHRSVLSTVRQSQLSIGSTHQYFWGRKSRPRVSRRWAGSSAQARYRERQACDHSHSTKPYTAVPQID